ncbi:MAG: S41 family peptidase [Dehalococcoidia bacterium]
MRISINRAVVAVVAAVAIAALVLSACGLTRDDDGGVPKDLTKVWEAYRVLRDNHIDQDAFDVDAMAEAAIRGMIGTLDDPFTAYFSPDQYQASVEDLEGEFEGIGAQVTIRDGQITIVSPLPDTPADRAGLLPGDVILAVEGESVVGLSLDNVIQRIRGPKGSTVRIRIRQAETGDEVEVSIVRDTISDTTVTFDLIAEEIARVRITRFAQTTHANLERVLEQVFELGVDGIVLDLRNNPGGVLPGVVDVASEFLEDGLVLYEINAQGDRTDWEVRSDGKALAVPLVVVVNEGSASASEVLAGALQDHDRAKVVGSTTFGKGVVDSLFELSDGSGLFVTTSRWFTPDGRQIASIGVAPDVEVDRTAEDITQGRDPQIAAALEVLRETIATQ